MKNQPILIIVCLLVVGCIIGTFTSIAIIDDINSDLNPDLDPVEGKQANYATLSTAILCMGLVVISALVLSYIRIYRATKSKYIAALLLFFIPALIKSIFTLRTMYSVVRIIATQKSSIVQDIGFSHSGFAGILLIVSIFELVAASTLLYLSMK